MNIIEIISTQIFNATEESHDRFTEEHIEFYDCQSVDTTIDEDDSGYHTAGDEFHTQEKTVQFVYPDNIGIVESRYELLKMLGTGTSAEVYLAYDTKTKKQVAIKILKEDIEDGKAIFELEAEALKKVGQHKNITKMYRHAEGQVALKGEEPRESEFIVLGYEKKGDLLEYIQSQGRLSEDMARYYLKQILSALKAIHSKGYSHRDLKPENFLLDNKFSLKIADFGLSTLLPKDGGKFHEEFGTPGYMAPEIHLKELYDGKEADLFAVGVSLFNMVTGCPPFGMAVNSDKHYRCFILNRVDLVWKLHEKKLGIQLSQDLMDLITSMLQFKPEDRLSLDQIMEHKWMKQGEKKTFLGNSSKIVG